MHTIKRILSALIPMIGILIMSSCSGREMRKDAKIFAKGHAQCLALEEADPQSEATAQCWAEFMPIVESMEQKYETDSATSQSFFQAYMKELRKCDISEDTRKYLDFMEGVNDGTIQTDLNYEIDLSDMDI